LAFGLVLVAVVASVSAPTAGTARPIARAAACDALGEADNYAIFSHENVTVPSGISMNGRIAAAGDVTLASGATISGSPSPAVIAGRDFIAGKSGGGGTVNGGVRYGRNKDVASNFTINGGLNQGASGIDFDEEFNDLAQLSDAWAKLTPTPGAQAILQYGALEFHGYSTGLNVFNITAADQSSLVQGVNITLDKGAQAGSTAPATVLINITTATPLEANAAYVNLNGVSADRLIWNLPQAPSIAFTKQVGWKGLILAPNASVSTANGAQLEGQLIAKDVPAGSWTLTGRAQASCPPAPEPPPEPDRTLDLEPLCVDPFGNLAMRVANTGTRDREVDWRDIGTNKRDFGSIVAQHGATSTSTSAAATGTAGSRWSPIRTRLSPSPSMRCRAPISAAAGRSRSPSRRSALRRPAPGPSSSRASTATAWAPRPGVPSSPPASPSCSTRSAATSRARRRSAASSAGSHTRSPSRIRSAASRRSVPPIRSTSSGSATSASRTSS
jgi:choice-of-anchor A domain-containing protein